MALIDVSELLVDPDFVDPITQIKRVPTIDTSGTQTFTETPFETIGSVQPASTATIQKMPEALRVANLRSFWIKGIITYQSTGQYPDILVFKGKRYQVNSVSDWSNFGEGYTEGTCVAEELG